MIKMKNLLLAIIIVLGTLDVSPQNHTNVIVEDDEGNEMLPFQEGKYTVTTYYDEDYIKTFNKNLISLYEQKFKDIINAFSQQSLLNSPVGFEAQFNKRIESHEKPAKPDFFHFNDIPKTVASLEIALAPYFNIDSKPVVDFHISSIFVIYLNNPYEIAGTPLMADIYPCPMQVDDFYGYPVYSTNRREVTVLNFTEKPLFIPVSQEDFINTLISYWEHKIEIDKENINNNEYLSEKGDQKSSEEKKRRQQEFENAYNELKKYDPQAAEELKKVFNETKDINIDDILMKEEGVAAKDMPDSILSFSKTQILRLKSELAAMNYHEKQRQAYYSIEAFEDYNNVSGLLPETHKNNGDALVRINPELVDDNPTKIELASVHWYLMSEADDKPRLYVKSNKPGLITDNMAVEIYMDNDLWKSTFEIISN